MNIKVAILSFILAGCGVDKSVQGVDQAVSGSSTNDERGPKGDKGDKGEKGDKGDQGSSGSAGSQGQAGTNGVDSHKVNVYDGSGALIGELYSVNPTTNEFYVVNGSMRMQFTRANGTFTNAYLVFAGANCTGAARIVITNGQFANMYVDGRDSTTVIKAKGLNLGGFNYASRVAASSSCSNTAGSATVSWNYDVNPTLGFNYPIVNADIDNE